MIWIVLFALIAIWLISFLGNFGGSLIHLLLILALVLLLINVISGRENR
ncbi:MAG TPA: lmo0937 family membrane protein [Actinobacteria bacterium]|nr:lmo0937 family membrane protein [Actinomycetota bacterium]